MWPDRVSNRGPLTYESGAPPTALRGPADTGNSAIALPFIFKPQAKNLPFFFVLQQQCVKLQL